MTPVGAKTQGLLAMLALARGQPCHRAALQDKLWSDRDTQHGRDSLKKALAELRRAFGEFSEKAIRSQGGPISLDPAHVAVDLFEPSAFPGEVPLIRPDFLEGIDIKDPEFDLWLQSVRAALNSEPTTPPAAAPAMARASEGTTGVRLRLAVMPVAALGGDGAGDLVGDMILSRIVIALKSYDVLDVFDFRGAGRPEGDGSRSSDITLCMKAVTLGSQLSLCILARRVGDSEVIWGSRKSLELIELSEKVVTPFVTHLADQLCAALMCKAVFRHTEHHLAARHAMDGIDQMFRLAAPNLDAAAGAFDRAIEIDPRGSYLAWKAYLTAFRLEKSKGRDITELREIASAFARYALERDPHNPLSLSLLTHVYGFVLRDFERAFSIISPIEAAEPDCVMYYDNLAMLHFYTGNLPRARDLAITAVSAGQFNPYRYSFSTSLCMIEAVMGDYWGAIRHGERALVMQANCKEAFEPNLRYLCAAYAHVGDFANATRIRALIEAQCPSFSPASLKEDDYPVPARRARDFLCAGFQKL